jgi:hypothetical protein
MLLSRSNDDSRWDWGAIRDPAHVAASWSAVERNVDRYFTSWPLLMRDDAMAAQLATRFRRTSAPVSAQRVDGGRLQTWVDAYEKSAKKYRDCFDPDAMIDYEDAPSEFKTVLAKRCEIIQRGLNSRNPDLKEWITRFKAASSQELLDVFRSMLAARAEYEERFLADSILGLDDYDACDAADSLALEPFGEDSTLKMPGVIGMGIRSAVLHFLNARLFLQQNRGALYGLYFLTDRAHFDMPSRTSPFLMIDDVHQRPGNDRNFKMEYNYWYPYELGTLFALRLYRAIEARCGGLGVELDPTWRYVYVRHFLDHVCALHPEDIKVMRGGDDLTWG